MVSAALDEATSGEANAAETSRSVAAQLPIGAEGAGVGRMRSCGVSREKSGIGSDVTWFCRDASFFEYTLTARL